MRKILLATAILGLSAGVHSVPALANNVDAEMSEPRGDTPKHRGYEGNLPAVTGPVALDVRVGDELAYLADNRGRLRSGSRGLRDGFGTGGHLGERDLVRLRDEVEEELVEHLQKRGIVLDPNASTVLRVSLVDAQPNRPTFEQLSVEPGLSSRSFGRGGASMEVEIIRAGGASDGVATYGYYTSFIEDAQYRSTWSDAHRAIDIFAKRVAKKIS